MKPLFERLKELIFKNVDNSPHGNFFKGEAFPEPPTETEEPNFNDDDNSQQSV